MPNALGFTDHTKEYFPHKFSSEKHLEYVGSYLPPSDYGIEGMMVREREEFDSWYGKVCQATFNFKEEALRYCKNDIEILSKDCVKFREQFFLRLQGRYLCENRTRIVRKECGH
ncbi:uncharacterized protein AKAME5_000576500 [Lates japonicus]|uniref:DNA-directed DNA polymerase n=1 Tax=Lates japonicus TaxID=270547 RepID=A0AAD3R1U4_LATJO|nr:uncharacterized protein AKAME5_000576500 [Lates japonicus]